MSHALRKNAELKVEESNMAMPPELQQKLRAAAADGEPAWEPVGKTAGVWIWRIEQFKVVPWPEAEYGNFFTGDSYILLYSYTQGDEPKLYHEIHFWLGRFTTMDEAGTAAYKTVELDDLLGGLAVQFREVQGSESAEFIHALHCCPGGPKTMHLMEGGVESGFNRVTEEAWIPRLYQVSKQSGQKVKVREVPCCKEALDPGDVFIVDGGKKLFLWVGGSANPWEKNKGNDEATRIADGPGRSGASVERVEEGEETEGMLELVKEGTAEQNDELAQFKKQNEHREACAKRGQQVLRLSDASGEMKFEKVADGLPRSALQSGDAFVVDTGAQVYVWIGSEASASEKKCGLQYANKYLESNGISPAVLAVAVLHEGHETRAFNSAVAA